MKASSAEISRSEARSVKFRVKFIFFVTSSSCALCVLDEEDDRDNMEGVVLLAEQVLIILFGSYSP
jgi:hypothetical protein